MTRPRRLLLLLLPALLVLPLLALPGRAQEELSLRYADADTTLLRDTLGLRFTRLFPLADSLGVVPDSMRALSVRYRWPLERLVHVADSLEVPVDSLGAYIKSLRLDRPSGRNRRETTLRYNTTYDIQKTSNTWNNSAEYDLVRGSWTLQNTTDVQLVRMTAGTSTSLRQSRSSTTETGWRLSDALSFGGRANLERFNSYDPGATTNQSETKNEFQLSMKTKPRNRGRLRSTLNSYGGFLDLSNYDQIKRGASGDLNGSLRLITRYVTHDMNGQVTGNLAQTRRPTATTNLRTNDLSNNLRGTLSILPSWPVGLNVGYTLRRIRVETPNDTSITQVLTRNGSMDGTLRIRQDNDRYVNATARYATQNTVQGTLTNSNSSRREQALGLDGRYLILGWNLEGRFSLSNTLSKYPNRTVDGGYGESLRVASISGTAMRRLTKKLRLRATGSVTLNTSRSYTIGTYKNTPVNNDSYRQSYKVDLQYSASERFSNSLALTVGRNVTVRIPLGYTSSNGETRAYDAEWRWNYVIMPGLTASQTNTIGADYKYYYYLPDKNTLALDYNVATTLNVALSRRFTMDIRHSARHQPAGSYTRLEDGNTYLSRSELSDDYTLSARMAYSPSPALSLFMQPNYLANERDGAQQGELVPTRSSRQLNFSGGVSLNLRVGSKGALTGNVSRSFQANRVDSYTGGVFQSSTLNEFDYWNGQLQFQWEL